MKLYEIVEIYKDINEGLEGIKPLILNDLKVSVKGKLHRISQELKPYFEEFLKKQTEIFKEYGTEKDGQIVVEKENYQIVSEKLAETLNEEVDLNLDNFKFLESDLNLTTELPLISFCKYLL